MRPLLLLLLVATAVQSVLHVVNVAFFDLGISRVNADYDASLAGWLGTTSTMLAAWAALSLTVLAPPVRRPMLLLAGACAFLSMDDMLAIHELVALIANELPLYERSGYTFWVAVYLPLMTMIGWLLLRTAFSIDVRTGRLIVLGLACLVTAVVVEACAPLLYAAGSGHGQPLYETEVVVEEALETLGWGAIALALVAAVIDLLVTRAGASVLGSGGRSTAQAAAVPVSPLALQRPPEPASPSVPLAAGPEPDVDGAAARQMDPATRSGPV